jgi:hypothetical protein
MVILHVLSHCPSEKVLSVLAADQLEDLIEDHGEAMIDRIERETQSNPAFKNLLCGVWLAVPKRYGRALRKRGATVSCHPRRYWV